MSIELEPVLSMQLLNPDVSKIRKAFDDGFDVLYVYGPSGSGKSMAINMLLSERNYQIYNIDKEITSKLDAIKISRFNSLTDDREIMVLVDSIDKLKDKELEYLSYGDWKYNKLILVGETWKKTSNPLSSFLKNKKKYVFKKIKINAFSDDILMRLIVKLLAKYKFPVSLEDRKKIVKAANGDIRKAINITKSYALCKGVGELEEFLPFSEETYYNRVKRMFSGNFEAALEEIENFGWYYSSMIIAENLMNKKKSDDLIELLMKLNLKNTNDRERLLAILCMIIANRYNKGKYTKWIFPRRGKKQEQSEIDALCANWKKEVFFI